MRQDVTKKAMSDLKKRYQISFRRWVMGKSGGTVAPYVGADVSFVREWLSNRFLEGMNWNNYGTTWVVDHIVPVRLFDLTNNDDLRVVWHYKNIMPLFKEDNLYKEGELNFSLLMLDRIPQCEIVENLRVRLLQDHSRLNKYLL